MITQNDSGSRASFLPVLAVLILLCLGAAGALTLLSRETVPPAAPAELSFVVQLNKIN